MVDEKKKTLHQRQLGHMALLDRMFGSGAEAMENRKRLRAEGIKLQQEKGVLREEDLLRRYD